MQAVLGILSRNAGRVLLIVAGGAALIFLDDHGFHPPTPPAWALVWAGWIISGLTLYFGSELLRSLRATTSRTTQSNQPAAGSSSVVD